MGHALQSVAKKSGLTVEKFDPKAKLSAKKAKGEQAVLMDFSHPSRLNLLLDFSAKNHLPLVVGTTGYSQNQMQAIKDFSCNFPVFYAANFSFSMLVFSQLVKVAATFLHDYDIEILEYHHAKKVDSPSGTAMAILSEVQAQLPHLVPVFGRGNECRVREKSHIGVNAIRCGSINGRHSVLFGGERESIELVHNAESREIFAKGAMMAARFLADKKSGFFCMSDLIDLKIEAK